MASISLLRSVIHLVAVTSFALGSYVIDDTNGLGRRFDGIGGLSGGGATSRLLVSYTDPYRRQILDYLFTPNFGASLHILKVEIGGDAQSTDGTEPSHMHSADDENYQRGYEWWLMKEAKARNPNIKLYGLPWGWPGWVGNFTSSPYTDIQQSVNYVLKWLQGAKQVHNLTIDYIGIWNERTYSIPYIKLLRKTLDSSGFRDTQIVASDGKFEISYDVLRDAELASAVSILGFHYPGTYVTKYTLETGKMLWSSEDYSTFNDAVGTGCWARILNQNYVNGNMTSTISWNLIASYYEALPFDRDGLMTAVQPWSGYYVVEGPIWISAHTTQFTLPGWKYYKHGSGAGHFDQGGSYVSLTDGKNLTIVIETMTHDHSKCIRPSLPPYDVKAQTASFILKGQFASIKSLNVFYSKPGFGGANSTYFVKKDPIQVVGGQFQLNLEPDEIYTLTTSPLGKKGSYDAPPPPAPFPVPYYDDFDVYPLYSEAAYFADQSGCFEIRDSGNTTRGNVMQQVATSYPVNWCTDAHTPISYVGNHLWHNVSFSVDANISSPAGGVMVAARLQKGGCGLVSTEGIFLWLFANGSYALSTDILRYNVLKSGSTPVEANKWFTVHFEVLDSTTLTIKSSINDKPLFSYAAKEQLSTKGFVAIGTVDYGPSQFDKFTIFSAF
ncbi:galactocerebrosidase-like isoform X1 [Diadema antillarum]|uniref:galactocerebrosidase-like isoform X1 n=1 Tax=Diadema antillarum TaxID=105358 RepID=UPI003A857484